MRVLVTVENSPKQRLLVILDKEAVRDVKGCLSRNNRDKAIMTALTKGDVQGRVSEEEARSVQADLILTKYGAYWNLS